MTYEKSLSGSGGYVCISSVLVERSKHNAVGGHEPLLAQQQDWAFILSLLRIFGDPVCTHDHLVGYHVHDTNASRDYQLADREAELVLRMHRELAIRSGEEGTVTAIRSGLRATRRMHGYQAVDQARASVAQGSSTAALRHLGHGLRLDALVVARSATDYARLRLASAYRTNRSNQRDG